jgi:Lrp/AsnC family leucine-responsive transcriptional regulator
MEVKLDAQDRKILDLLQEDARISHSALGRVVHLSQPAVSERIKRLESAGVIESYRAHVDPAKLGYTITAMIRVQAERGRPYEKFVREAPEIVECRTVTGEDCAVLRVLATDVQHLQRIVEALNHFGNTSTSIILSTQVAHKPVRPPPA